MPELPEVQTIVTELNPRLRGRRISAVEIYWDRTIVGDPGVFTDKLVGQTVGTVKRRGKYLVFLCRSGLRFTIHLKMTGKLLFNPSEKDRSYIRVRFDFTDFTVLYFVDVRKFGRIQLWPRGKKLLPGLGPEPLKSAAVFLALSRHVSCRPVKTVLLDQRVIAGVGNIYADEVLFLTRIHPLTPFKDLGGDRLKELSRHLPLLLRRAIRNKGTTISDYRNTENRNGSFGDSLYVYGRSSLPCYRCGKVVKRICINARSSHFCPGCQPITVSSVE